MGFRLLVACLMHETNTFAPQLTQLSDFEVYRGEEAAQLSRGMRFFTGGMLAAADDLGASAELVYFAGAEPSGTIAGSAYDTLKTDLLESVQGALPADAIAVSLHGAAVAEGTDDVDADLLHALRELVGPSIPIVVSLDLHGNVSAEMAMPVQAMFGVREYPHVDMFECGHRAVSLLPRLLAGEQAHPAMHVERLPMLIPPITTFGGPMAELNALCIDLAAGPGMIDVTFFHGFPYADVPCAGAAVVAIADGDAERARTCARRVAARAWQLRERFRPNTLTPAAAVQQALALGEGPVVINEVSDNSGGGAPGDGTHLLRAMLEAGLENSCFGFIVDAEVAAQAQAAGPGAVIDVSLGGKSDSLHGSPITTAARVKSVTDGRFVLQDFWEGRELDLGPMCRLVIGGVDVLVASRRNQVFDPEVFLLHGIDVRRSRIVGLKSANHFRAGFQHLAHAILTADSPGLTTLRMDAFVRTRTERPSWPLDAEAHYGPILDVVRGQA
ncbi:MAG: M81 family metallopeptidase [Candidatus Dormibacteria bacterium]